VTTFDNQSTSWRRVHRDTAGEIRGRTFEQPLTVRPLDEKAATQTMSDRVYIFDTTLRDGEQSPGCSMTVSEKKRMARKLVELGVDILEAGFPIASDGDFEAVDEISREFPWVTVAALARSCTLDVERAARSLKHARRPRIHTFIATSDIHLKHKLKKSRQQILEEATAAVELARGHVDDVEFSAEDGARTDAAFLEEISRAVVAAGARTVNIPDTVGYSAPREYAEIIGRIVNALGDCAVVSVHCHDDLGLAVPNSLAAVEAGARQIECTVNGIGERAGNCSLEEVVMVMKTRNDLYPYSTGINTEQLYSASELLSSIIAFGPQPNKAIVGRNAFAHEAGIHQDGYLKERTTYEIIDPKSVGVPEGKLVLGKHSGRHALHKRCEDLGFSLTKDELDSLYHRFIALADRKKGVMDEEIISLIGETQAKQAVGD
jgi:2-isopropylmalate synthase